MDSLELAALAYRNSIRVNPNFVPAYFDAANMYKYMGHFDSAYSFIRIGLKKNPNFPNGHELLKEIETGLRRMGY
jgi:hypothetical protein